MTQPLLEQGGMVDKIMGDALMTLFGVLPATESRGDRALKAALRIIEAVREVGKVRKADNYSIFEPGIGIASGSVVLGLIGSQNQKTFIAAGCRVELAEKLGRQARPNEILIDENTFNKIGKMQEYFSRNTIISAAETAKPIRIYSYLVK